MPNMEYCMFENTSRDLQDVIDKIYEDGFHPEKLSQRELRAFQQLYDQAETLIDKLLEIEDMLQEEDDARYAAEEAEEARQEEYEMHKAIVGKDRADEDFFFHPNDGD